MTKNKSPQIPALLVSFFVSAFPINCVAQSTVVAVNSDDQVALSLPLITEKISTELDSFLMEHYATDGSDPATRAPGLVLLVDTPDGQYLNAVGVQSLETQIAMRTGDVFEIGSNSKSFTIVLLMQLQEQGVLSIDQRLNEWLPEWAEKIPYGDEVTLRQLAGHTSGIWDYGDPVITESAETPEKLREYFSPEQLVQYAVKNGTPDFAPGAEGQWNYTNTGYILLGMIIEKAAGASLDDLYQSQIFEPLDLKSAKFLTRSPDIGEIVEGYYWTAPDNRIINTTFWNVSQGWAAGGIIMTAEDLATYGKALAAGEFFENDDTLQTMLEFNPDAEGGIMPFGLGLIDFSKLGAEGYWGHEGQTAGFQTLWLTNPELGVTIVGLSNSANFSGFYFLEVAKILVP